MEESSRESQPRCPCGFWGSSKTLGLCSVCYRRALGGQSQGNTNAADAGRTGVGTCPNQSQNNSQGKRMDSKHFPSRSTADNLPSSLSSPPGERAALSAAQAPTMDATTPSTSGGATSSSHMPATINTNGSDVSQTESAPLMLQSSCEPLQSSSESDLCSTVSSDTNLSSLCTLESSTTLVSVTSSSMASYTSLTSENDEESLNSPVIGNQISGGALKADVDSSTHSLSNSAKTLGTYADTVTVVNNSIASSNKNSALKDLEVKEMGVGISSCDINSQAYAGTLTDASRGQEQALVGEESISSTPARGIKRSRDEMEASSEGLPAHSPQKNKNRCFKCSCKLELAQRTIGRCRCDRVFCARHRLPELHKCEFNHKEDGRREAREKMIKPTRHLGPSYRRDDHT